MRNTNITGILLGAILTILLAIIINLIFNFSLNEMLIICWVLTTFYSIFAFYLASSEMVVVKNDVIRYVEKPVYFEKQVPIQVPVENRVVEVVDRTIEKNVPVYVERETKAKKLNIPHYEYVGSDETKRFHKRSCRLSKLIKNKHKVSSNSKEFFKKKGYKGCKVCINNNK